VPILPMVVDRVLAPDRADDTDGRLAEDGRLVGHALRRLVAGDLAGLFDDPSTVRFRSVTANGLPGPVRRGRELHPDLGADDLLVGVDGIGVARPGGRTTLGGLRRGVAAHVPSGPATPMDAQWRLARHYGIANMLIFHKIADLDNVGDQGTAMRALVSSLLANAETRIIYRQESDQTRGAAETLGLTTIEMRLLPTLSTGQGLWRIKDRSFVVQHQFHPAELALFDTTQRMGGKAVTFA